MTNDLRGSVWWKWDLHVHTPKSIIQDYDGDTDTAWEAYITALEALPAEIKVLGINDYIFVDGYEKVLSYKNQGRLQNIDLILPVIELRVDKFVGNTELNRINYHVIFSNDITVDTIKSQFIASLSSTAKLDPDVDNVTWSGVITEQSLTDLGRLIYDNAPVGSKPTDSPKVIGFNNINFSLDTIKELLRTNTYLKDHITAIGQNEWASFRWTGSASDKKTIINSTDLVLTASPLFEETNNHINTLSTQGVNHKIIHSSDAHQLAVDSNNTRPKDLGHCFTWIKADTTFEGLKQVLYDYGDRVRLQANNPYQDDVKYVLDSITMRKSGVLKSQTLPMNRDLISIIGSKGSGKSLLLSAISSISDLGGYEKHRHPIFGVDDANKKQLVDIDLIDKNGTKQEKHDIELSVTGGEDRYTEPVLYIAQEELARRSKRPSEVRKEYLRELGINDLSIGYQDITDDTQYNLDQLDVLNEKFSKIAQQVGQDSEKLMEYLTKKIKSLETTNQKLSNDKTKTVVEELSAIIAKGQSANLWRRDDGFKDIDLLAQDINERIKIFNAKAKGFGIKEGSLLPLVDTKGLGEAYVRSSTNLDAKLKAWRDEYKTKKEELEKLGVSEDIPTLLKTVENIQRDISTHKKYLEDASKIQEDIPKKYDYLSGLFKDNSIIHQRIAERIKDINNKFTEFKAARNSSAIFGKLFTNINVKAKVFFNYKQLESDIVECFYKGKLQTVDLHKSIFGKMEPTYELYFKWIENYFWNFMAQNTKDFKDRTNSGNNGLERLRQIILLDWYEYVSVSVNITHTFDQTIKEIGSMSTGELATVLLKLILVTQGLDKQIILLDQPEDHLDNEFIANDLVELIRTLKKMRQIIMVTHNANLVVMTDSEQVVVARGIREEYLSGGIENPDIKENIIKILEGGSEAFKKRYKRYGIV